MNTDVVGLLGIAATLVTIVGGAIVRDRQIHATIEHKTSKARDHCDKEVATLHERVNRTRDEMMKESDMVSHWSRVEGSLTAMQGQLNMLISHMITKNKD